MTVAHSTFCATHLSQSKRACAANAPTDNRTNGSHMQITTLKNSAMRAVKYSKRGIEKKNKNCITMFKDLMFVHVDFRNTEGIGKYFLKHF